MQMKARQVSDRLTAEVLPRHWSDVLWSTRERRSRPGQNGSIKLKNEGRPQKVPPKMQPVFDSIVQLSDEICRRHPNDEYAELAREITAALSRKRPSPLVRGDANVWACGIVHALGYVNFLFDSS